MGKLHEVGNVTVRVYPMDHLPPHFHAVSPDHEALIDIASLSILAGGLPPAKARAVLTWARENRAAIAAEWNRINPRFPVA